MGRHLWSAARILPAPGQCKRGYPWALLAVAWCKDAAPTGPRMLHSQRSWLRAECSLMFVWGGSMCRCIWRLVGLVGTLLVIAMSARPGHRVCWATAEGTPLIQETLQMA